MDILSYILSRKYVDKVIKKLKKETAEQSIDKEVIKDIIKENGTNYDDTEIKSEINDIWKAQGELGVKNLCPCLSEAKRISRGITYTRNEDCSITLSGTIDDYSTCYFYNKSVPLLGNGEYIASFDKNDVLPVGVFFQVGYYQGASYTSLANLNVDNREYTFSIIDLPQLDSFIVRLYCDGRYDGQPITVHTMIRLASDTDNTWQPYAPTNKELANKLNQISKDGTSYDDTEIKAEINDVWKVQGKLGAKNLLKYPYGVMDKTIGSNGVNFILDDTDNLGQFVVNGTSVGSGYRYASRDIYKYDKRATWVKAGTYILSNGVDFTQSNAKYIYVTFRLYDRKNDTYYINAINPQGKTEVEFTITDEQISAIQNGGLELNIRVYVNIPSSVQTDVTFDNVVIKPMIRYASDTDDTWQPYVPTNKGLAEQISATKNDFAPIIGEYLPIDKTHDTKKRVVAIGATSTTFYVGGFMSKYGIGSISDINLDISAETSSGNVIAYNNVTFDSGTVLITFDELTEAATFVCKASKIQ